MIAVNQITRRMTNDPWVLAAIPAERDAKYLET